MSCSCVQSCHLRKRCLNICPVKSSTKWTVAKLLYVCHEESFHKHFTSPGPWLLQPQRNQPGGLPQWNQVHRQRPGWQALLQCDRWGCTEGHCGCAWRAHLQFGRWNKEICYLNWTEDGWTNCMQKLAWLDTVFVLPPLSLIRHLFFISVLSSHIC